uniref:Uncharacterized protein n=1 Tax=Meloidogyne hapla TaxID=6305 RepID=A0A1I8BVI8_MELHA
MWKTFQICYKSRLDPFNLEERTDDRMKVWFQLQNIPYSGYGRKCNKPGQHGIEVRVCARRISFVKDDKNHKYDIVYKIVAKMGFSYTYKSFSFENSVKISGIINKTNGLLEMPIKANVIFPIFTIQIGIDDSLFAKLTFMDGTELDYSSDAKFKIKLAFSNNSRTENFQSISEGNEAISLLGLDMDISNNEKGELKYLSFPEQPCYFTLMINEKRVGLEKHCEIFFNKQNFVTNRFEFRTFLQSLSCNSKERKAGVKNYDGCKYPSDNENHMRDNYAKSCYENLNNQQEKHGIEFRISATRIAFNESNDTYWITIGVNVSVGFSFSEQIIEFGKRIQVNGKIKSDYKGGPRTLGPVNMAENHALLFSLELGNAENNFATLTDEMNGIAYNFDEHSFLARFENQNIQKIAENGGALALIGPDMNMKRELLLNSNFNVNIATQKMCTILIQLTLNNELMDKQFNCYKRPENQCDKLGLEKYNELKNAFDKLLELYRSCPCPDQLPQSRPKIIVLLLLLQKIETDDRLIVHPESRGKRSIKNGTLLENRYVDRLVPGCEDKKRIGSGDIDLHLEDVERMIESQQKCN